MKSDKVQEIRLGVKVGYLISGIFTKFLPDRNALDRALPASIGFALYHHPQLDVFAIDMFRASKPSGYPFSSSIPANDITLELGQHLAELSKAYELARQKNEANGFKRSYINLAESLSSELRQEVLAVYSDDDSADFVCKAAFGRLTFLSTQCGEEDLFFEDGRLQWQIKDEFSLHQNAAGAFAEFTKGDPELAGFGSFDPPDMLGFIPI